MQSWSSCLSAVPKWPPRSPGQNMDATPWPTGPLCSVDEVSGTVASSTGWAGDGNGVAVEDQLEGGGVSGEVVAPEVGSAARRAGGHPDGDGRENSARQGTRCPSQHELHPYRKGDQKQ